MLFFTIISLLQIMMPRGVTYLYLRGMVGRISEGDYLTLLHTKYKSSGPQCFREEYFYVFFFSIVSLWKLMTPRV